MLNRNILSTLILLCISGFVIAQPSGFVSKNGDDMAFRSDTEHLIVPSEILVSILLTTTSGDKDNAVDDHLSRREQLFSFFEKIGASYSGQSDEQFDTDNDKSLFTRKKTYEVSSILSISVQSDEQLISTAALINNTKNLRYESFSAEYTPSDSIEILKKSTIDSLISDSQNYQNKNSVKLSPRGISKMDVDTETFGDGQVTKLLKENDLDSDQVISTDSIGIIGVRHRIAVEILFR